VIPAVPLTSRQDKIRKFIAWSVVVAAAIFVLYWIILFILVWITGLPPWKIGVSPWA
jgi:Trk-type K+ transport system membrane component